MSISGTVDVGQVLTAVPSGWTGNPAPSYTYQWQRSLGSPTNFQNIVGETASTYTVVSGDAGYILRVLLTASNGVGSPEPQVISAPTVAVPDALAVTVGPTWVDNENGTATISVTFNRACYCGADANTNGGSPTSDYNESALSYTNNDPDDAGGLLLSDTHAFTFPEQQGSPSPTLADGSYPWRLAAAVASAVSMPYVAAEQVGTIANAAPVLSFGSPTTLTATSDGATGNQIITSESGGTLYWAVVTNGGSVTAAQLKAGSGGNIVDPSASPTEVAGSPQVYAGSQAVSASGLQTLPNITGLLPSTTYQVKYLHTDALGKDSAQASAGLTTAAAAGFDSDAQAIINACVTTPNAAAQTAINDFVVAMKAISTAGGTAWEEIDEFGVALYTGASADTDGDSRINWKAPPSIGSPTAAKFTKQGSPTFAQDAGSLGKYTGVGGGSPGYLIGIANYDAMAKYLQDDASLFVWPLSNVANSQFIIGQAAGTVTGIVPRRATNDSRYFINQATNTVTAATVTDGSGMFMAVRTGANVHALYRNGVEINTGIVASTTRPASPMTVGFANSGANDANPFCVWGAGSGKLGAVASDIHTAFSNLITALQAAT